MLMDATHGVDHVLLQSGIIQWMHGENQYYNSLSGYNNLLASYTNSDIVQIG